MMVRWMPVLRGDDKLISRHQAVRNRNDLVTRRHRQRPAGQKVVLNVDQDKGFHLGLLTNSGSENWTGGFKSVCPIGYDRVLIGAVRPHWRRTWRGKVLR